jgi:hypothetical protein
MDGMHSFQNFIGVKTAVLQYGWTGVNSHLMCWVIQHLRPDSLRMAPMCSKMQQNIN